jgi:SAM-dependent methyltransferase
MQNTDYWNNEGVQKVFTHPICSEWIKNLDRKSSVLDLGCGYGRLTPSLRQEGFSCIFGYDFSAPMIERAIREYPGATYTSSVEALSGKPFDLILCFALFTSCPSCNKQVELVSLINNLSQESALLYISDYETRDNPNYFDRYKQRRLNIYGCFSSGNAVFRHHEPGHFDALMTGWTRIKDRSLSSETLNGNYIIVHQYLYKKITG